MLLTLNFEPHKRLVIRYDMSPYYLQDILDGVVEVESIDTARNITPFTGTTISTAVKHFTDRLPTRTEVRRATELYLTLLDKQFEFVNLQGYSQGDWADVVIFRDDFGGNLAGIVKEIECWFRGDIYIVALEEAKTFTAPDGETITRWDEVDAIGGFINDDLTELKKDAMEAFGIDEKHFEFWKENK